MIVRKSWCESCRGGLERYRWDGWFLFGIIPLYLHRYTIV